MTDKDNLLHLDGDSKKLFPDGWYVDKKKTSIVIQEFFTYSFFRTGKSEKRNKLRYNFPDGKFIETIGYVNSTDQQVFMIFLDYVIMPIEFSSVRILMFHIPINLAVAFMIAAPGLLVWYFVTLKYFWWQIDLMKDQETS